MQLATQMRSDGQVPEQPKKPKLTVVASGEETPEAGQEDAPVNAALELGNDQDNHPTDDITKTEEEEIPLEADLEGEPPPPRTPPRRGHLRVVK
jgi:hypothetical protein